MTASRKHRTLVVAVFLVCALLLLPALAGCGKKPAAGDADPTERSAELTPGEFPEQTPQKAETPPPPMLRDPKTAVYSYLVWISYAYRVLDSNVATMAFSEYEEVRVNSYVELNRQQGRAIDQRLLEFEVGEVVSKGSTATVPARESWRYRYIDTKSGDYNSPAYEVTYDTTYTVVEKDGRWLVDKVEVAPLGEQPE